LVPDHDGVDQSGLDLGEESLPVGPVTTRCAAVVVLVEVMDFPALHFAQHGGVVALALYALALVVGV
jgi:hypothetical protein